MYSSALKAIETPRKRLSSVKGKLKVAKSQKTCPKQQSTKIKKNK